MQRPIGQGPEQRSFCPRVAWGPEWWPMEALWFPKWGSSLKEKKKGPKAVLLGFYGGVIA